MKPIREKEEKEEFPPLPPISKKSLKDVSDVLISLKKENGEALVTREQSNSLANLRFSNGEQILSLEYRWFVYEIVWLLNEVGYQLTYNYLSTDWEKVFGIHNIRKKMLFENPLMAKSKEKFILNMEIYRNKVDVEMGEPCKRCGSENTVAIEKQMKRADEMANIFITCISCGFRWTAQ